MKVFARVRTRKQFDTVTENALADAVIVNPLNAGFDIDVLEQNKCKKELYLEMPEVLRGQTFNIEKFLTQNNPAGVFINNIDSAGRLCSCGYNGKVIAGEFMYGYNSEAVCFYKNIFPDIEFISPPELTIDEIKNVEEQAGINFIYKVYGHQTLMVTAQSINDNYHANDNEDSLMSFSGEMNGQFFALKGKSSCNLILDSAPVYMLDRIGELSAEKILLDLTIEKNDETGSLLAETAAALAGQTVLRKYINRGHYYKKTD